MTQRVGSCCSVCGATDARALVNVTLIGGASATLCGSHAIMNSRSRVRAHSTQELRELLGDRRGRRDRRELGDALGDALAQAFRGGERRGGDRRRA